MLKKGLPKLAWKHMPLSGIIPPVPFILKVMKLADMNGSSNLNKNLMI
jgi:hypothetical protein